jgi:hypothetical protein
MSFELIRGSPGGVMSPRPFLMVTYQSGLINTTQAAGPAKHDKPLCMTAQPPTPAHLVFESPQFFGPLREYITLSHIFWLESGILGHSFTYVD